MTSRVWLITILLVLIGAAPGRRAALLAGSACPSQPDYTTQFLAEATNSDPVPAVLSFGLPILGPVPSDPNIWSIPCGPQRIGGTWCDPEGQSCSLEIVESDLPCEASISQPQTDTRGNYRSGTWALTIPNVTPEWHVVRVRLTDTPPPYSRDAASRDVLICFRGEWAANQPPVLY